MKIGKYNQMKSWLHRPASEETKQMLEEKNKKELEQRRINTRKKYGLDTVIYEKDVAMKDPVRHILVTKLTEEGEKSLTEAQLRYLADTVKQQTEYEKSSSLDKATKNLVKYSDIYDDNSPVIVANGSITTESKLKKEFKKDTAPSKPKTIIAKKPIKKQTPINLNLDFSVYANDRVDQAEDQRLKELEKNFNKIQEQKRQEKIINGTRGLRYFAPEYPESSERNEIKLNNIKKEDNNDM